MAKVSRKTIPAGGRAEIVLDSLTIIDRAKPPPPPDLHQRQTPGAYTEPVVVELYDLGVTYQEFTDTVANEVRSKFTEISLELSNSLNAVDRAIIRNTLIANLSLTEVAHSERVIWSAYRLQAGSTDTDGTITTVTFTQNGTQVNGNPLGETLEWSRRVPTATRLADFDLIPETEASRAARAACELEEHERWEVQSASRTKKEGTLRKRLTDGGWEVGINSYIAYQPWRGDSATFKVTDEPRMQAAAVRHPPAYAGRREGTRMEMFLAPQMMQWEIRWVAHYFYGTLFSQGDFFLFAVTQYSDRLPFFPFAYQLSLVGTVANWTTMSRRISQTLAYQRLLALDRAIEVVSSYLIIILVERIGGRWTIRFRDIPGGTLCAITKTYRNGGAGALTRYVWRPNTLARANDIIDHGHLDTAEVVGDVGFWTQFESD